MLILLVHETNAEYLTLTWLGCRDTLKNRRKKEGDKGYPPPILTNNKNILRTKANAIFFLFCEAVNNLCCFTAQLWNAHLLSWHPLNIHTNPPPNVITIGKYWVISPCTSAERGGRRVSQRQTFLLSDEWPAVAMRLEQPTNVKSDVVLLWQDKLCTQPIKM